MRKGSCKVVKFMCYQCGIPCELQIALCPGHTAKKPRHCPEDGKYVENWEEIDER